jgi:hypothetical protein
MFFGVFMPTNNDIKIALEKFIELASRSTGVLSEKYTAKAMLRIKRYPSMKSGYYVTVQNFSNVSIAKKSSTEKYYRYTFRCIQFKNREVPLYEIEKWTPVCGSVEDGKVIYRSDAKKSDGKFLERMETVMMMVQLGL